MSMMDNFFCPICSSSDSIQLQCGCIQCRSCSQFLNEANIQCSHSNTLPVSNRDFGITDLKTLCDDCGQIFDSNSQYGKHKKKKCCPLEIYGCKQQIDSCSMDKHLSHQSHIQALRFCLIQRLQSPVDLNLIKDLTEYVSQNNHRTVETLENDELKSINDSLVLDFSAALTTCEIQNYDHLSLTDEERHQSLNIQSRYTEQIGTFIQSRINQTDEQLNNISIQQDEEYNISLTHVCQRNVSELQQQLNQLSLKIKQEKEMNQHLIHFNEYLFNDRNLLDTELSNKPVSKNGLLIWLIENIREKIDQSYPRSKRFIDSPRFLTLTGEHPLNARLFLYGDPSVHPNYISIHLILSPGGNKNLFIPITCCLVDQTNNHQHIIQQARIHLNQDQIGIISCFSQFVPTIDVHEESSRFVQNNTLCLIVKLYENELNQYNHYPISIQHALRQINSLTLP